MKDIRRGYTLLEIVIVVMLTLFILATAYAVLAAAVRGDEHLRPRIEMQLQAARAMHEIIHQLKCTGLVYKDGEIDYPYIFQDGQATAPGKSFLAHAKPIKKTKPGKPDPGPCDEVAFKIPRDTDGDGHPTKTDGSIDWSEETLAFVVVPNEEEDTNELQMVTYDGHGNAVGRRRLARDVERTEILTEDPNTYRINIWFSRPGPDGKEMTFRASSTANMRSLE